MTGEMADRVDDAGVGLGPFHATCLPLSPVQKTQNSEALGLLSGFAGEACQRSTTTFRHRLSLGSKVHAARQVTEESGGIALQLDGWIAIPDIGVEIYTLGGSVK